MIEEKKCQNDSSKAVKEVILISNCLGIGGAARVIEVITGFLIMKGFDTSIIAYNESGKEHVLNNKIKIHYIRKPFKGILGKINRILRLRRFLKGHRDSVVIAFEYFVNIEAILAARNVCRKVIISERNDPKQVDNRRITKLLRDYLYKYADNLVCQTNDAKKYFPDIIQKKTVIIPNPVKSGLSISDGKDEKDIVTFCRITAQKNLYMMVDAFKLLLKDYPDYKLSIFGDGDCKSSLQSYCKEKGLSNSIFFYPYLLDIHQRVSNSFMFLSTSNFEGLSNSMLEAMAMGLPVVCTDCDGGGARMIIKDKENGMLVPKGDTVAFYKAMKYLIDNADERNRIRLNALKIRDELSEENIGEKWLELINKHE